jgi:hypothetical protein
MERKARKSYKCSLCFEKKYILKRITTLEYPDNEYFVNYRAHSRCNFIWQKVGDEIYWSLPCDKTFWEDLKIERPDLFKWG